MRGSAFEPIFAELGVSHLYLSPILTAAEGSSHGYDVTDPTTVSAELGGAEGIVAWRERLGGLLSYYYRRAA